MTAYPSIYAYKYGDLYTLGAFAAGVGNACEESLAPQMAMAGILGGLPLLKGTVWDGPKWLYNNFGHYGESWKSMKDAHRAQKDFTRTFKTNLAKGRTNIFDKSYNWLTNSERLQKFQGWQAKVTVPKYDVKHAEELLKAGKFDDVIKYGKTIYKQGKVADCYKEAAKIVERINSSTNPLQGKELKTALKELEYAGYKGQLKELEAIKNKEIPMITKRGKVWNFIKKPYNCINKKLLQGMTYGIDDTGKVIAGKGDKLFAKSLRTVSKGAHGGGLLTAGIEMACDSVEIYDTYKELGAGKGTKQLGKSAATATASAVGWVAGAKVGGILGAKIGGAIGSIFPGPGTVIGGAIGSIFGVGCGILGSYACHKGMKSLLGKSELEKAREENGLAITKQLKEATPEERIAYAQQLKNTEGASKEDIAAADRIIEENVPLLKKTQQTNEQSARTNYAQATNGKSALLQQLESFNTYISNNPFNKQSIFS